MKFCLYIFFLLLAHASFSLSIETEKLIEDGKKSFLKGNHDKSIYYFNLATSNLLNNNEELCEANFLIGKFYSKHGIHDSALKYFFLALDQSLILADSDQTQEIYNRIGGAYYNRMHYLEAKKYWEKSKSINKVISNQRGLSNNLNNLGEIEYFAGNYFKAIDLYKESCDLKQSLGDSIGVGTVLVNLANACFHVDKLDTGFLILERSQSIAERQNSVILKQYISRTYGKFYQQIGDLSLSIIWYHKSLSLLKLKTNTDNSLKTSIYDGLKENHRLLGNIDSSLFYQNKQNDVAIDIIEDEKELIQTAANIKSSMIKKDNEIDSLKDRSRFRRNIYFAVIFVLIIVILFGFIINRQRNKVILQKNITIKKEKELLALKSRFIATASHQFRTPLTVIQSSIGLMALQRDKMSDEFQVNFDKSHKRIKENIELMTTLMDEVLISETIASDNVEIMKIPTDLVAICRDVVKTYNDIQTDGREIEFKLIGKAELIPLNKLIMEQAISNLVSNALKYSVDCPPPILTIEFSDKIATISVKDFGIGIPEEDLEHLFEPFFRASNVGEYLGTGLGLAITKEYVSLMDGTFSIKSEINAGSEFIVALSK